MRWPLAQAAASTGCLLHVAPAVRTDLRSDRRTSGHPPAATTPGARAADTGVDHAHEHRVGRETLRIGRQQVGRGLDIEGWQVGKQVDDRHARRVLLQDRMDLSDVGSLQTEVREQHQHGSGYPVTCTTVARKFSTPGWP